MTASRVDGVQAPDILSEVVAGVGFITLNRPRALNALNLAMVRRLTEILLAWRSSSSALSAPRQSLRPPPGKQPGEPAASSVVK